MNTLIKYINYFLLICSVSFPFCALSTDNLDDYVEAEKTWGDVLNPQHTIPEKGFQAYYININNPKAVMHSEVVERIALNEIRKPFHGIPTEYFGAYWVGNIHITKDGLYQLAVKEYSENKTRVLLNRHVVFSPLNEDSAVLRLKKGTYTMEVEHITNYDYSSIDVLVNITPLVNPVDKNDLPSRIKALNLPDDTVVFFVSAAHSKDETKRIKVDVTQTEKPYLLILTGRWGNYWDVTGNQPELIIYNDFNRGSIVKADAGIPVWTWNESLYYKSSKTFLHQCDCDDRGNVSSCHDVYKFAKLPEQVKVLTGFPLAGVSAEQKGKGQAMLVPEIAINAQTQQAIQKFLEHYNKMEKVCEERVSQPMEELIKSN